MRKIHFFFFFILSFFSLAAKESCEQPKNKSAHEACLKDEDCAEIKDGCCGCNQGGQQRAILLKDKKSEIKSLYAKCQETNCTMRIRTDGSCAKKAVCEAGQCVLR